MNSQAIGMSMRSKVKAATIGVTGGALIATTQQFVSTMMQVATIFQGIESNPFNAPNVPAAEGGFILLTIQGIIICIEASIAWYVVKH
jgi:hypothetical protein